MPLLIAVVLIVVIILLISWLQDEKARRRGRQLRARAETLGLRRPAIENTPGMDKRPAAKKSTEHDAAASRVLRNVSNFLLFAQGRSGDVANVMEGEHMRNGTPVAIVLFEYIFSMPMGRYTRYWRQTVVRLASTELELPGFGVMPEGVFDRMVQHIQDRTTQELLQGTAGISFKGHPNFNQMMHVQAPNRTQVRQLFDDQLLGFFEGGDGAPPHYNLCVEGSGDTLLVYRYDREVAPEDLEAFLDTVWAAYDRFAAANRRIKAQTQTEL
jgi:hypothetical protein